MIEAIQAHDQDIGRLEDKDLGMRSDWLAFLHLRNDSEPTHTNFLVE